MRRRPEAALAGCEPPSRQTPRTPLRATCVCARFQSPSGFDRSRPFSVSAARSDPRAGRGNCKLEGSAAPCLRFHPDPSTLALDNLLTNRQTDARAGNLASMQAFEHAEHPVGILRIDPDSVVPHRELPAFRAFFRRDMDSGCFPAAVLDRIGDEVLEKLHEHDLFRYHGW